MDPNFSFGLCNFSNGTGSFPPQPFKKSNNHNIYPNELIYLAALAGVDLDILFRGVDLLT